MQFQIYVDADACPVKQEITQIAKKYGLAVTMILDTSHEYNDGFSKVIIVEKATDSVDFAIMGLIQKGDVLITQDFGLASMALGKQAFVINQNGFSYTQDNIDRLLFERHLNKKSRRSGLKTNHPKKRTTENNLQFAKQFEQLILELMKK